MWQYEQRGSGYIGEALNAQWFGDGYDLQQAFDEGLSFEEMNPEQQGRMAEYIGAAIAIDPNGRLLEANFEAVSGIALETATQWPTVTNAHAALRAG